MIEVKDFMQLFKINFTMQLLERLQQRLSIIELIEINHIWGLQLGKILQMEEY